MQVPRTVKPRVLELARSVVGEDARPQFVRAEHVPGADPVDCFATVARIASVHAGEPVYGWKLWEEPGLFLEAEFHAVWRDASGELIDVSPSQIEVDSILFVPDPSRTYQGRQTDNVRLSLTTDPAMLQWFAALAAKFEFDNRGSRAYQQELRLNGIEQAEYREIKAMLFKAHQAIRRIPRQKPRRNEPCPCGSGLKFKRCCGLG